ncbi:HD domain-containing phosphohydrolase [Sulfurimonas sp. C5]|uniref:HD-GYP domain-containing protein n=1 Tax=Sulfurimonas sp. C5 TaxID=3036947 RepID=UPI002458D7D5|nr:HD domain-containing phosphohydrolase [Sulfurimonas sp. C5]MDH4945034.1 HD domain-containing phosphohydrolase [Sulfurimonas sp. C5]
MKNFNLNTFLISISFALDLVEKELLGVHNFHSKRVAYISLRLARLLGLDSKESFDLVSLAVMHDNGLTEAALKTNLVEEEFYKLEQLKEHCVIGEKNVRDFPFLTNPKNIILYHHEHYDGSGFFGKKGDEIPLMSQIIAFADLLDSAYTLTDSSLKNKHDIYKYVEENKGILFDPIIAEAFFQLARTTAFWLDVTDFMIVEAICNYVEEFTVDIGWNGIFQVSKVFSKIIDTKSKFTARHTAGLIEKIETMAIYYKFDQEKVTKLKIAASLHDLGKLAVSNKILEKETFLDPEEINTIQSHTYFTHRILHKLDAFEEIEEWAYQHHEKLDGSGYPYGLSADELCFESRLMGCLDIYQALTEHRPYRESVSHTTTMKIMTEMVANNKIDKIITKDIDKVFGIYIA